MKENDTIALIVGLYALAGILLSFCIARIRGSYPPISLPSTPMSSPGLKPSLPVDTFRIPVQRPPSSPPVGTFHAARRTEQQPSSPPVRTFRAARR